MQKHVLRNDVRIKGFPESQSDFKGPFENIRANIGIPYLDKVSSVFTESPPRIVNPLSMHLRSPSDHPAEAQAQLDQIMMITNLVFQQVFDNPKDLLALINEQLPALLSDAAEGRANELFLKPVHQVIDQLLLRPICNRLNALMPGKFNLSARGILTFDDKRRIPPDFLEGPRYNGIYGLLGLGDSSQYPGTDGRITSYTSRGYPKGPLNNFDFRPNYLTRVKGLAEWIKMAVQKLPETCFEMSGRTRERWIGDLDALCLQADHAQSRIGSGFDEHHAVLTKIKEKGILESNRRYQQAMELGLGEAAVQQMMNELGRLLAVPVENALNDMLKPESFRVSVSCYDLAEVWEKRDQYMSDPYDDDTAFPHVDCPQERTMTAIMALRQLGRDPFFRQLFNPDAWFIEVEGRTRYGSSGLEYDQTYFEEIQIRAGLNRDIFWPGEILQITVEC